ncbi:cytochrome c oxidase subunit 6a [Cladophialophora psammophila CBS 110553]|uniref:Cytochrome c oxidase subunit 13, mitochondrial n=1 Tax=Cladophialophora psammophila CBS 110553 TaxID=1182543 RepID=W9XKB2_9EURO|nr:cytochrome c oxidase subunit 6a [Cladophialophora psammophila CBS 110553]EXJ70804.1 cytochrome c oxidase subunit 6a [Cladophialophora psammophila CBS 110553]
MSFQRVGLRLAQQQLRSPAFRPLFRATFQRRLASSVPSPPGQGASKLVGTADNAFNRERAAVKAHAAATSDLWRKLSIFVVVPCLVLASINAWNLWNEHWEHWSHMPPLEERVEYPYQNIRTRNFWWGEGDKTLFWNDKVNYHKKDKQT